jgi:hypothetical protein
MNISFDNEGHRIWQLSQDYDRSLRLITDKSYLQLEDLVEKIVKAEPTVESFEKEMKERLEVVCKELGVAGYKRLWVGVKNPHYNPECSDPLIVPKNLLVVEPYIRTPHSFRGFFDIVSRYLPTACGGAYGEAMYYYLDINLPKSLLGEYVLEDYGRKES